MAIFFLVLTIISASDAAGLFPGISNYALFQPVSATYASTENVNSAVCGDNGTSTQFCASYNDVSSVTLCSLQTCSEQCPWRDQFPTQQVDLQQILLRSRNATINCPSATSITSPVNATAFVYDSSVPGCYLAGGNASVTLSAYMTITMWIQLNSNTSG